MNVTSGVEYFYRARACNNETGCVDFSDPVAGYAASWLLALTALSLFERA
jgi:hypothetical protein